MQEREAGQGKHGDARRAKQTTQARLTHLSVGIEFTCPECRLPLCDPLACFRVASFVMTLYSKADCCESDVPAVVLISLSSSTPFIAVVNDRVYEGFRKFATLRAPATRMQIKRRNCNCSWCTAQLTCVPARLFTPSWCLVHMQVL